MRSVLDRSDREDVRPHQPRCVKRFRFRSTRVRGHTLPSHRPKAEALSNAVDVVERLHDPTDQVPDARHLRDLHTFSSMTSLKLLILQSVEGEFCQHDGVVTVMVMLATQGFA